LEVCHPSQLETGVDKGVGDTVGQELENQTYHEHQQNRKNEVGELPGRTEQPQNRLVYICFGGVGVQDDPAFGLP